MLASTELSHSWSFDNKLDTASVCSRRPSSKSPRMSHAGFETPPPPPLANTTEWTGQYSYLPPAEPVVFAAAAAAAATLPHAYSHIMSSNGTDSNNHSDGAGGGGREGSEGSGSSSSSSSSGGEGLGPNAGSSGNGSGSGIGSSGQSHATRLPLASPSTGDGDGSGRSASPLDLHHHHHQHRRGGLDQNGMRSPSTPTSEHDGSQQQQQQHQFHPHYHHHHHLHLAQHQHYHNHNHSNHNNHSGNTHDSAPLLPNNTLSVLPLPGMATNYGGAGGDSHALSSGTGHGGGGGGGRPPSIREEGDDLLEEEDMGGESGVAGGSMYSRTALDQLSQRRKMKRFRLTHQQTRFLMSEFAKQAHPDAAQRERLSREIPGLSPRQVQVWFQNRRAKIKRLAADDRERMVKMRAVPDDFDSVQALHAPYGSVHGLGTPLASPVVEYSAAVVSHYGDHMPLPGLCPPAFGTMGFHPSASMGAGGSVLLSPLSPTSSSDHHHQQHHPRYSSYSSHFSTAGSATSASAAGAVGGARSSGNSNATALFQHHHQHQPQQQRHQTTRPLQPLQLRDILSRSRSDNLQSPLRSSMSWKGDALDYNDSYQTADNNNSSSSSASAGASAQVEGRPQQPLYPSDSGTSYDGSYSGRYYHPVTDAHGLSGYPLPDPAGEQPDHALPPTHRYGYAVPGP